MRPSSLQFAEKGRAVVKTVSVTVAETIEERKGSLYREKWTKKVSAVQFLPSSA
jgi:hypothetical protein